MGAPIVLHTHLVEIALDSVAFGDDLLQWSLEPWWDVEDHGPLDKHVAGHLAAIEADPVHAQFCFDENYVRAVGAAISVKDKDAYIDFAQLVDPTTGDRLTALTLESIRPQLDAGRWLLGVDCRALRASSPGDFDMRRGVVRNVRVQVVVLTPLSVLTEERVKTLVDGVELVFSRDPDYWRGEDTRDALGAHVASVSVSDQTFAAGDLLAFENGARVTVCDAQDCGLPLATGLPGRRSRPGVVWFCEEVRSTDLGMEPDVDDITVGHIREAGGRKVDRLDDAGVKALIERRDHNRQSYLEWERELQQIISNTTDFEINDRLRELVKRRPMPEYPSLIPKTGRKPTA